MEGLWVQEWPSYCAIILVWGSKALDRVAQTKATKWEDNISTHYQTFAPLGMRVVVFDGVPANLNSGEVQMFGGRPTLVIDMSQRDHISMLIPFLKQRKHVICLNTPFYLGTPVIRLCRFVDAKPLIELLNGSAVFTNDTLKIEALRETIQDSVDHDLDSKTCHSCMKVCASQAIVRHVSIDCSEGHSFCVSCDMARNTCYHPEHKRTFNLPTEIFANWFEEEEDDGLFF